MTSFALRSTEAKAGALALIVHGVFFLLLVFGVSWQTQHPATAPVMVDLWQALPAPTPAPVMTPTPPPEPPPQPVAKAPRIEEQPTPKAPDIALKKMAEQKKIKQAQEDERHALADAAREETEKLKKLHDRKMAEDKLRDARKKIEDQDLQRRLMEEELASETRQLKQMASSAASSKRMAEVAGIVGDYKDKVSAKVRGNTRLPENLKGNPQVKCQVRLLPTGEVLDVKVVQSSGNPAYDDAVERAIRKSSPLPLPEDKDARAAFVPEVILVHRPKE
ncbi:MAG: cell envelope integrity protein TolA [Thiobacillaceae bacterium]